MIRKLARAVAGWYRGRRWFRWTCDVVAVGSMFLAIAIAHGLSGLVVISRAMQMFGLVQDVSR